jgi:general stress protein 26
MSAPATAPVLTTPSPWTDRPTAGRRLPADLHDVVRTYRTAELATLGRSGAPVAWPVVAWHDPATGTFTVTTSIAFAAKLRNLRRDARVSLLFSDPTGTDRDDLPQVLVQGTATVDEQLHVDPAALEDYWTHVYRMQPSGRAYSRGALRGLFDWYFFRAAVRITPGRVRTRLPAGPPVHRHGAGPRPGRSDRSPAAVLARDLPAYRDAVVSWPGPDGLPWSARVGVERAGDALRVHAAPGEPLRAGPAGLLLHRHDALVDHQRSTGAVGTLRTAGEDWYLDPGRVLPGMPAHPVAVLRVMRRARGDAARYLDRAGLARPEVPWEAYQRLADRALAGGCP